MRLCMACGDGTVRGAEPTPDSIHGAPDEAVCGLCIHWDTMGKPLYFDHRYVTTCITSSTMLCDRAQSAGLLVCTADVIFYHAMCITWSCHTMASNRSETT